MGLGEAKVRDDFQLLSPLQERAAVSPAMLPTLRFGFGMRKRVGGPWPLPPGLLSQARWSGPVVSWAPA